MMNYHVLLISDDTVEYLDGCKIDSYINELFPYET